MKLIEAVLKIAAQLLMFFVTLAVRIISGIVGALWQAYQNRAPRHAPPNHLARAAANNRPRYPKGRRKQWRRR